MSTDEILHHHLRHLAQAFQAGDGASFARALVLSTGDNLWDPMKANGKGFPTSPELTAMFSHPSSCPAPLISFISTYLTYLRQSSWADDSTLFSQYSNNPQAIKDSAKQDWTLLDGLWDSGVKVFGLTIARDGWEGGWMGRTLARLAETLLHAAFRSSRISQDARSTAPSNSVDKVRRIFQLAAVSPDYSQGQGQAKKGDPAFALGNICWRVYDQLHTYRLLDTISQTYAQMRPSTEARLLAPSTTKAERVGYWFWCGKLRLAKGQVREARDHLTKAFEECPVGAGRNLRAIFIRLATCQILLGRFPSSWLLSQFHSPSTGSAPQTQLSDRLVPLMRAIQSGDRAGYHEHLRLHGEWFRRRGLWLILREKGELLVWRGLFRNAFSIWTQTNQPGKHTRVPIGIFLTAARLSFAQCGEEDVDLEDVISILASLIDQSYIKGYISHTHQTLVMAQSATDPYAGFPVAANVRPRQIAV